MAVDWNRKFDLFLTTRTFQQRPLQAMDVGAAGGVVDHWQPYLPILDIDAFEPNANECERQQQASPKNIHWHPYGLARTSGLHKLHVLQAATGSSLYPPNQAVCAPFACESYRNLKAVIDVPCLSLTDFLERHNRPHPHLIKLDTQGSELDILKGLPEKAWDDLLSVETEVEFAEAYIGQPLFPDVHQFMLKKDFFLAELKTHNGFRIKGEENNYYMKRYLNTITPRRMSAMVWAGDALYFKNPCEQILKDRDVFLRYLTITFIYSCFDLSAWLLEEVELKKLFDKAELDLLWKEFQARAPRPGLIDRADIIGRVCRKLKREWMQARHRSFWDHRDLEY